MIKEGSKKAMQIANICYASILSEFVMLLQSSDRGKNFTWTGWAANCEKSSRNWMYIHDVKGDKAEVNELARQYSKDIANRYISNIGAEQNFP
jgi:hypothetical protein